MRPLTELERAVYETPDGRHCVLVIGRQTGKRPALLRGDGTVQVCYLVDGRIPSTGAMEFAYLAHDALRRCGELIDARTMAGAQ